MSIKIKKSVKTDKTAKAEESKVTSKGKNLKEEPTKDSKKKKNLLPVEEEPTKVKSKTSKKSETKEVMLKTPKEAKYNYPEDMEDPMSKKKWRHEKRNQLKALESALGKIKDKESKEYKKAEKELKNFKKDTYRTE